MHYLDNSATTCVLPEAAQAVQEQMCTAFGNPSSQHRLGNEAAKTLKRCRETVAKAMGAGATEIVFTSGGTESTNTALFGAAVRQRHLGKHMITTAIEHSATLNVCKRLESEGWEVTYLQPNENGEISAEKFSAALRDDTVLASVMLVNNEVGTVMPVAEMGAALKKRCPQALFHIDAVQGLFRIPLLPTKWNCDFMSVSGHKIGAPKGIGALYIKKGVHLRPYLLGGGQEGGMRSGTEPMPAIAGFAAACEVRAASAQEDFLHVQQLHDRLVSELTEKLPWAKINGKAGIPHVINISFPKCKSEVMLRVLEGDEVYVSAGSACSKGHESHVLKAMGMPKDEIDSALRVSFAPFNTAQDVDAFVQGVLKGAKMLRR